MDIVDELPTKEIDKAIDLEMETMSKYEVCKEELDKTQQHGRRGELREPSALDRAAGPTEIR